jgi:hypothetical protein
MAGGRIAKAFPGEPADDCYRDWFYAGREGRPSDRDQTVAPASTHKAAGTCGTGFGFTEVIHQFLLFLGFHLA